MSTLNREAIARLSNEDLNEGITKAHQNDLEKSVDFLLFLAEVDQRKLYLEKGYSSLFTYLVRCFNFCETAAAQRKAACQLMLRFPVIEGMLRQGEIHLTALHLLARHFTDANHAKVLMSCRHKSRHWIERYILETFQVATNRPKHDSIRPLAPVSMTPPTHKCEKNIAASDLGVPLRFTVKRESTSNVPTSTIQSPNPTVLGEPSLPKFLRLGVTIDDDTLKDLERAKEILGVKDLGIVIRSALKVYLKKIDPLFVKKPKTESNVRRKNQAEKAAKMEPADQVSVSPTPSRYIRVAQKKEVHREHGGQCAFVGSSGLRCIERRRLQVDHCVPLALGGANSAENYRLLCPAHNLSEARRVFGAEFINRKIAERRSNGR